MVEPRSARVESHGDLRVYRNAMEGAMRVFQVSKSFPAEEKYSMVDQMRRSSRSGCANIAEAWRKRRYKAAFISKLSDAESEACETQVWLEFSRRCGYLSPDIAQELHTTYDHVIAQIVKIIQQSDSWLIRTE